MVGYLFVVATAIAVGVVVLDVTIAISSVYYIIYIYIHTHTHTYRQAGVLRSQAPPSPPPPLIQWYGLVGVGGWGLACAESGRGAWVGGGQG